MRHVQLDSFVQHVTAGGQWFCSRSTELCASARGLPTEHSVLRRCLAVSCRGRSMGSVTGVRRVDAPAGWGVRRRRRTLSSLIVIETAASKTGRRTVPADDGACDSTALPSSVGVRLYCRAMRHDAVGSASGRKARRQPAAQRRERHSVQINRCHNVWDSYRRAHSSWNYGDCSGRRLLPPRV